MKKDIDLLSGFNEAKDKKSSSSSSLLVAVLVVALIGVMVFMFVTAKNDVKDKKAQIEALDQQLLLEGQIQIKEEQNKAEKARYEGLINAAISDLMANGSQMVTAEISDKLVKIIFDNYVDILDEEGEKRVEINAISVSEGSLAFSCKTRTYQDAWDFVDYMRGQPQAPLKEGATEAEKAAYDDMAKKLEANSRYFSNVLESYPGLPNEGDGKTYSISLGLSITVDWEAVANDETN